MNRMHRCWALALAGCAFAVSAAPRFAFDSVPAPGYFYQLDALVGFTDSGGVAGIWNSGGSRGSVAGVVAADGSFKVHTLPPSEFVIGDFDETHGFVGQRDGQAWRVGGGISAPIAGLPTDRPSRATAINAAGVVIGSIDGPLGAGSSAFIAVPGQAVRTFDHGEIPAYGWDINDRGEAVYGTHGDGHYRVDTTTGRVTPFAQDYGYGIYGAIINNHGDIAVDAGWRYEERVAVFGRDGTRTDVPQPPGLPFADLKDFNDRGQVLHNAFTAGPGVPFENRYFLYTPGEASFDLLAGIDVPQGWSDLAFTSLNDRGDVLGFGTHFGIAGAFVLRGISAPVPEPGAVSLLALGMLGVGAVVRRRCPRVPTS